MTEAELQAAGVAIGVCISAESNLLPCDTTSRPALPASALCSSRGSELNTVVARL